MTRRMLQLFLGLALYGLSVGLMVRSNLGVNPWDVFHQGLSELTGLGLGTIIIIIGAACCGFRCASGQELAPSPTSS